MAAMAAPGHAGHTAAALRELAGRHGGSTPQDGLVVPGGCVVGNFGGIGGLVTGKVSMELM